MKRVKFFFIFLLPAIFLFVLPHSVLAETIDLNPVADSFVNDGYAGSNYGSADSLITSATPVIRSSFLKFDLSPLPSGATVDNTTLHLYLYNTEQAVDTTLICRRVTADWSESGITWNNQPGEDTTSQANSTVSTALNWKEWNVTDIVRNWHSGSWSNYGLKILSSGGAKSHSFRSREYTSNKPILTINYHLPEPTPIPSPTPTLTPTPTPKPKATPTLTPTPEEEITPTPEETPIPTPEEKAGLILGIFTRGQAIIAGLILLALIGAGVAFAIYSRKPTKRPEEKEEKSKEEE